MRRTAAGWLDIGPRRRAITSLNTITHLNTITRHDLLNRRSVFMVAAITVAAIGITTEVTIGDAATSRASTKNTNGPSMKADGGGNATCVSIWQRDWPSRSLALLPMVRAGSSRWYNSYIRASTTAQRKAVRSNESTVSALKRRKRSLTKRTWLIRRMTIRSNIARSGGAEAACVLSSSKSGMTPEANTTT